jgi:hypothetical protein
MEIEDKENDRSRNILYRELFKEQRILRRKKLVMSKMVVF